jgi:hypothetical protein
LGFEPTTKDFSKDVNIDGFAIVLAVNDFAQANDVLRVHLAAKRRNIRYFLVTKKCSSHAWEGPRQYAREMNLEPVRDDPKMPPVDMPRFSTAELADESDTLPGSGGRVRVLAASPNPALMKEINQWQELASQYEKERDEHEKENTRLRGEVRDLEAELRQARDIAEAARRNSVTLRGDLERVERERSAAVDARDEHARKLHTTQTMLSTARRERDEAKTGTSAKGPKPDELIRVAQSIMNLVTSGLITDEEALDRLVTFIVEGKASS